MSISYGTYTITNIQEGSQIWTASVAPTTPNYTFNISNLTGDSETSIKVGDIIMYDFYRYTVSNVNSDGTTVLTGDRTSIRGATGASATTYHLILSTLAIVKGSTGSLSPSSIVLTAKSQSGSNAMANYSGRFKIETTTDNSTWSTKYTSSGNEATKTYTLPTNIVAVRCSLYLAGGTTTLLDQQTVPVVTNGIEITSTSVTYQSGTSGTTKPTGTWQTTIPSVAQGNYLWTKTVVNYSDGTSTESYSVARQGNNGTNGEDGTSPTVTSTVTEYVQSTDGVNKPTSGWNTTPPTAIPEQYIWSRVTVTYSDNATAVSYSVSRNGTDGTSISISSTSVTYQKGTSGTTKPTGTWQTGIPSIGEGEYLWTKTVVTYSDSSKTESYSVSRNATNGTSPTVTSTVTEYVQSDSGTNKPTSGWNETPPTAVANKYMWTKVTVTYSDGATAISYSVAKNGTNGNNGVNTATIYLYKRATSTPSVPSGNTTYTFSTKTLTGTLDNWEQSIPTGTDTCYVIAATASSTSSTDTISSSEWSTPIQFNGTDGTNGYNQATIFLYHRGASATKPTSSVTYTFSSGALSSTPTGWSRTVPAVDTDKNPCWVTTAVAISKNSSVSIASSGWSTPTKMVEDGIDGIDGKDGTDGKDAYTVSLSNDNHTFAGDTTKAIPASVDCSVIGFKGATQVPVTIGTITGMPNGMSTPVVTNNNTTNAYFTVSVTASMTTRNGVLTIPVTIDGKTFTKKFTYSLALKGEKGENGGTWYSGTGITGTSTTATIFSNSGITSAVVGDMYLNTTKYNTYRCTVGGNASTAKWVYVNNIKGIGISSIKNQYYLHTSSTTAPASTVTWLDAPPAYEKNHYYWTRSYITWSGGNNPTTTTPVFDNALTDANKNAEEAKLVANNYMSEDSSGVMIADLRNGTQHPSDTNLTGKNVLITNTGLNIRDGKDVLASYGDTIMLGKNENKNVKINNNGVTINNGTTQLASYGDNIVLGEVGTNKKNIYISPQNGVDIRNNTTSLANFNESVRIGQSNKVNIAVSPDKMVMTAPNGNTALVVKFEEITAGLYYEYGAKITDENNKCFIDIYPASNDSGTGFSDELDYNARMNYYIWQVSDDATGQVSLNKDGFQISGASDGDTSDNMKVDWNCDVWINDKSPIVYTDVPVDVSYAAGTIGTRGGAYSLGSTAPISDYKFIGAFILDHQNTSKFNAQIVRNGSTRSANLIVYRASGSAVENASVTVRMMWASNHIMSSL